MFQSLVTKEMLKKVFFIGVIIFTTLATSFILPPFSNARTDIFTIEEGASVRSVASRLEQENIIRSSTFFTFLVGLSGGDTGVQAGTYSFKKRPSVFGAVQRLVKGDTGLPQVKVTIPEGSTVRDIAIILKNSFSEFDEQEFLNEALPYEGYLFPETYYFVDGATPKSIITNMKSEFDKNIASISQDIANFDKSLADIVVMASILEKEARKFETKQTVSGILWKRIELNIPLQVDAVFGYILNTNTFSPTFEQLKIDSPYNTYTNKGLPPGPIANPGLDSLKAAVTPTKSSYLYYLTGVDGVMHYAKTFDEHVANRRFLR